MKKYNVNEAHRKERKNPFGQSNIIIAVVVALALAAAASICRHSVIQSFGSVSKVCMDHTNSITSCCRNPHPLTLTHTHTKKNG